MYPDKYDGFVPKEPALMRLNHYPPCPDPSQAVGLLPHTDANLFTILHQGDVAGLQVLNDDRWVAVRPHPHAFAINVGDMLQVLCFFLLIFFVTCISSSLEGDPLLLSRLSLQFFH